MIPARFCWTHTAAPSLFLLTFFYLKDRYEREPLQHILMAFGLGLYARYESDPDEFRAGYDDLLSSTGLADAAVGVRTVMTL